MKNTWKDSKSLIAIKNLSMSVLRTCLHDGNTITNPHNTANILNNYIVSVAETAKLNLRFSHKHFSVYLKSM